MTDTEQGVGTDNCELGTYSELADVLAHLPILVREHRRRTRKSLRGAAAELDMSASTIARLEEGQGKCGLASAERLIRWLGEPVAP